MPSVASAFATGLTAAVFFTSCGWSLARLVIPGPLAFGVAPALGWAAFSVIGLPVFLHLPYTPFCTFAFVLVFLVASLALLRLPKLQPVGAATLPWWVVAAAGILALLPAIAIVPKYADGGILLGPQMYDHAKVAIIDQIMRQGMPPQNPFFGLAGTPSGLAYYYLWYFAAALAGSLLHVRGWTADIAMTWFTAFSSAVLMMALAVHITGRMRAIWLVAALCIPASIRPFLGLFTHNFGKHLIITDSDIGAWLNQASWVPQHLASGCCCVISAILIARIAVCGSWLAAILLSVTVAAGFESSTWVGGVTFAVAAVATAPLLMWQMTNQARGRFVIRLGLAVVLVGVIIVPFCLQQAADMAAKHVGVPIALRPYRALGSDFPASIRSVADFLVFWPLILPFNFPALLPVGAVGCAYALAQGENRRDPLTLTLVCFATACLAVTWLASSTIDNNDLGWRAVIPSLLILPPFAALAWSRWPASTAGIWVAAALVLGLAGVPQQVIALDQNIGGQRPADAAGFAQSVAMWKDVRRFAAPGDRVGNNPQLLARSTPWADNISWALLSNRPSCYSGWATAIAYAAVPRAELRQIDALFQRVFAGHAQAGDVENLAVRYGCQVIVITPADGAWLHDPFADAPEYRLVDSQTDGWKIYQRRLPPPMSLRKAG